MLDSLAVDTRPAQAHNACGGGSIAKEDHLMKPRLFVLLFIAGLLVLGILAIACGDDGGGNDEDAIRKTIQEIVTACNAGDSQRYAELRTATGFTP